jgi:uncharacterized lipoprotein NlpE involved in copper resistance
MAEKKAKSTNKKFIIEKSGEKVKLQINDGILWLDEKERDRIMVTLNKAMAPGTISFPIQSNGTFITYENGTIAVSLSVAKLNTDGTTYIIFASYQMPGMIQFETDMFYVTREVMEKFMLALAG